MSEEEATVRRPPTTAAGSAVATRQDVDKGPVRDQPEKAAQPAAVDKPDPYQNFPHGMNDAQIAEAMKRERIVPVTAHGSDDALGRLFAKRRWAATIEGKRALESNGAERKGAVSTHPRGWPEGAGDDMELTSTEGWSGR